MAQRVKQGFIFIVDLLKSWMVTTKTGSDGKHIERMFCPYPDRSPEEVSYPNLEGMTSFLPPEAGERSRTQQSRSPINLFQSLAPGRMRRLINLLQSPVPEPTRSPTNLLQSPDPEPMRSPINLFQSVAPEQTRRAINLLQSSPPTFNPKNSVPLQKKMKFTSYPRSLQ
ncbi:hypothetical protein [Cyclobacterium roseum]|uniref:hypothetical protein n=1 Tax=Cyclobacterium roseum TaxID=2666137 RepID=UPI001391BE1D|nr:hypothetical protein [Cyclobacterium roseum]